MYVVCAVLQSVDGMLQLEDVQDAGTVRFQDISSAPSNSPTLPTPSAMRNFGGPQWGATEVSMRSGLVCQLWLLQRTVVTPEWSAAQLELVQSSVDALQGGRDKLGWVRQLVRYTETHPILVPPSDGRTVDDDDIESLDSASGGGRIRTTVCPEKDCRSQVTCICWLISW